MPEISDGFIARGDGEPLRHRAVPESGKLREDEPHPVALLLTAPQFGKDPRVEGRLGVEEALEIEGIGHGAGLVPGWFTSSASSSRSSRWLSRTFAWADGRSNHSARSISGKLRFRPPFGGHSISKVLLFMVCTSTSPST